LYAYRCTQCGHKFEKIQSFSAEPERKCPRCGGLVERPLTAPSLQFKGAGWYINDYAPKSSGSAAESTSAEAKAPESKEAAKAAETPASAPASSPAPATVSKPASTDS
jgi:putative FmdB family regulatory protein